MLSGCARRVGISLLEKSHQLVRAFLHHDLGQNHAAVHVSMDNVTTEGHLLCISYLPSACECIFQLSWVYLFRATIQTHCKSCWKSICGTAVDACEVLWRSDYGCFKTLLTKKCKKTLKPGKLFSCSEQQNIITAPNKIFWHSWNSEFCIYDIQGQQFCFTASP